MEAYKIQDIKKTLQEKKFPTVMMWNRLEGRPKTHHFDRALRAEVRDALWMITRQWQMGEYKADDAGSPVFAKIHITSSTLNQYEAAGHGVQTLDENVPLEVKAEQKKIPFNRDNKELSMDIRLQMGRYWLKLLDKEGLDYRKEFITRYKIELPVSSRTTDYIFAHKEVWQQYAALSGRVIDGYKLYQYISITGNNSSDGITLIQAADQTKLDDLGKRFIEWYKRMYVQPVDEKNNAWLPDRLEYQFSTSALSKDDQKILRAEEYYQGQLDWYVFDIEEKPATVTGAAKATFTNTFIPAHVQFDGMPDTRWWKFEDGKTNLGAIQPSTTDLSKLLLMEFGLVYANDWFLVPYALPVGSLSNVEGLTVKNNFGETIWIIATENLGPAKDSWSMFKLFSAKQNNTMFLAPSAIKVHEGNPIEEILLVRDEMSNMVWGIETIIPSPSGTSEKGGESALQTRQFHENIIAFEKAKKSANFYFNLLTALPNLEVGPMNTKTELEQNVFDLVKNLPDRTAQIKRLNNLLTESKDAIDNISKQLAKENPDTSHLQQTLDKTIKDLFNKMEGFAQSIYENIGDKTMLNQFLTYLQPLKNKGFQSPIYYQAMTEVPENWVPFLPVNIKDDNREIQLQRASMLRVIDGDLQQPVKIKPQTSILREGLENIKNGKPDPLPYFIHEEEVTRAGIRVTQSFQRTRWVNGEVYVWLGMKKKTGRGGGSSGLMFDQIAISDKARL